MSRPVSPLTLPGSRVAPPHHPRVTLVPVLDRTSYRVEDDQTTSSLAFIRVQLTVLRYLDSYASDQLTQAQAHLFTRAIDLLDGRPTIQEAIKLCYYMRSLGFDTYARILPTRNVVRLHVVVIPEMNEGEMVESQDKIYWEQHIQTGRISANEEEAPFQWNNPNPFA